MSGGAKSGVTASPMLAGCHGLHGRARMLARSHATLCSCRMHGRIAGEVPSMRRALWRPCMFRAVGAGSGKDERLTQRSAVRTFSWKGVMMLTPSGVEYATCKDVVPTTCKRTEGSLLAVQR